MLFRQIVNKFYNITRPNVFNLNYVSNGCFTRPLTTPVAYEIVNEKEKKKLSEGENLTTYVFVKHCEFM